jgi:serine/threonine protein kinase
MEISALGMIGQTISHYRIVGTVTSGTRWVYDAEDTRLGRHVALKFIHDDLVDDPKSLDRFMREARAASQVNHPGICTIYDIEELEGHPFIIMEKLEGVSLKERLLAKPIEVKEILDIGVQVSDALAACHARGIIHRNIKPSNIFLTKPGQIKILGFGIAKLSGELWDGGGSMSQEGSISSVMVGTPRYMSPEQSRGEQLDARTDLFSLGIVLYQMATGQNPFDGINMLSLLNAILTRKPVSPLKLNPALPPNLEGILFTALEKNRDDRYPDAVAMRDDLQALSYSLDGDLWDSRRSPQALQFYSCFISYSARDQEFAQRIRDDLIAKGVRCWFAPHDVRGGRKLHEQIDEAIRLHDKVLLILSEHSMSSNWVKTEIAKARKREVQEKRQMLFPVALVPYDPVVKEWECFDADRGKDSAKEIREYFIPDFSNWKDHDSYQTAFQRLVSDLKAEAGK